MTIVSILTTGLWVPLSIAFAVVFVVKYSASLTGILGAIGSAGHAVMAVAYVVLPVFLYRTVSVTPDQVQVVFGLLNGLNLVASALVFVAILLAPVPPRKGPIPVAPAWTPPPVP